MSHYVCYLNFFCFWEKVKFLIIFFYWVVSFVVGSLSIVVDCSVVGSLWIVVARCGSLWARCGSLWVVVGARCGSTMLTTHFC